MKSRRNMSLGKELRNTRKKGQEETRKKYVSSFLVAYVLVMYPNVRPGALPKK